MGNASLSSGMLAVLMVAMLVSGWTEGSMLSKCEVKSQLEAAFEALQSVTADNNLAKWVCTVEATSRFNTSLVTIIDPSRPRRLIRRSFPIDNGPTQEVIADYFEDMFSKETLVTENPDGTSLIPEGMISTQVAEELSIPPEAVIEDFIPASSSRQPKERLAEASTQDNKPSERNPIHSVDRQGRDHRKEKVHEIKTREASGEIIDFSGDYSGQGSKEEASGEAPEGSGDLTEEPLEPPFSTPQYPIDDTVHPDSGYGHVSGDYTEEPVEPPFSTPEYPIDDTVYPDSDLGHGSGDHTEQPVVPSTSSPEYPIDETFYPGYDSGEGSGEGSGIRPHFSYKQYWNLLFKRKIVSSFKLTKSPVDSRELLSEPQEQDLDLGDGPYTTYDPSQNHKVLYGIFQLSDDVACQSESKPSRNLCELDCNVLINDDISDDIKCLMTLKQLEEITVAEECHFEELSGYFETCD